MNIYFAGSITGGRNDRDIYLKLIEHLKKHGKVLTEHIGDSKLSSAGEVEQTDEFVYTRDTDWIKASDIIVAEVTQPSLGVGYELGLAESLGKNIFCLYRPAKDKVLSRMISGNAYNTVRVYTTLEEACEQIDRYMEKIAPK